MLSIVRWLLAHIFNFTPYSFLPNIGYIWLWISLGNSALRASSCKYALDPLVFFLCHLFYATPQKFSKFYATQFYATPEIFMPTLFMPPCIFDMFMQPFCIPPWIFLCFKENVEIQGGISTFLTHFFYNPPFFYATPFYATLKKWNLYATPFLSHAQILMPPFYVTPGVA